MKTSKQKALELCMYFQNLLFINLTDKDFIHSDSKKCALKVCEEAIQITHSDKRANSILDKEYWLKVKTEIEKL